MPAKESSSSSVVKGKLYPGTNSPIVRVTQDRGKRIVHLQNKSEIRVTKSSLREFVHGTINQEYKSKAVRSLRVRDDGSTAVTIGGAKKGERKVYATQAAAKAAITRHYGR